MVFFSQYWLSILSGILIGTSYIPLPPWASLFAFVPLWLQWQKSRSLKEVFLAGWLTQFTLSFIGFHWIAHLIHEFGGLPLPISYVGLLLFCGFANLYIPLAGIIWFKLRSHTGPGFYSLLTLPMILWLMETFTPTIFKWNFGYPLFFIQLPAYHLAEYIGAQGLSALVIFANLICLMIWKREKPVRWGLTLLSLIIGANLMGWLLSKQLPPLDKTLHALVVQANIGNMEKVYAEKGWGFRSHITRKYIRMTRSALHKFYRNTDSTDPKRAHPKDSSLTRITQKTQQGKITKRSRELGRPPKKAPKEPKKSKGLGQPKIDFVLWPETAFPNLLGKGHDANPEAVDLFQMIMETQTPLITGAYSLSPQDDLSTNSIFFINERGHYADKPYHKTHLVIFGEYLPGANYFPILREWLPQVADFYQGQGPGVRTLNNLKVGAQICYESLFPEISIDLANKGAQVIVNVTNDSWYGPWQEPYQHLYPTLIRAVETRRPLIRSTNTGISTTVLASGEILRTSPLHREWSHVFEIPYASQPKITLYQAFPWLLPLVVFMLILLTLRAAYKENHNRQYRLEDHSGPTL